jgi:hypothetical protein
MEIRCGGCNKLFRIPDEKITGKGIKFACTRCGEAVKVTREEFDNYTLSKSAVSVLDLFEEKTKPAKIPEPSAEKTVSGAPTHEAKTEEHPEPVYPGSKSEETAQPVEEHPQIPEPAVIPGQKEFERPAPPVSDIPQEEPVQPSGQPEPSTEQVSAHELRPEQAAVQEPVPELSQPSKRVDEQVPAAEPEPEPQSPQQQTISEPEQTPAAAPVQAVKPAMEEPAARPPESARGHEAIEHPRPAGSVSGPRVAPPSQHEPSPYKPPVQERIPLTTPEPPSRSMNMFLVYSVMIVLIVLVGYGVFKFIGPGTQKTDELFKELSSTEGLRIVSASGSMDPQGDLVITCSIENALGKERPVWYVVVDIYNDQGSVISRIRSINGKQLFTQRDYDIFSKRGENVQELKVKNLQDQGVEIPPKSSVTFEIRYLQPAHGVSSFNALVHPFDPVRLFKELAEEIQQ